MSRGVVMTQGVRRETKAHHVNLESGQCACEQGVHMLRHNYDPRLCEQNMHTSKGGDPSNAV